VFETNQEIRVKLRQRVFKPDTFCTADLVEATMTARLRAPVAVSVGPRACDCCYFAAPQREIAADRFVGASARLVA
jgi:hypothetical protein